MASIEVHVPDIGEYADVDVIEILVSEGDSVSKEDALITLETDKATMDIPSPQEGVIEKIIVKEGDKVSKGTLIMMMKASSDAEPPDQADAPEPAAAVQASSEAPAQTTSAVQDIVVPDIGEYADVDVIEVTFAVGDELAEEDPMITLETDKATMEVPSPMAGKVTAVSVKEGDKVSKGSVIGQMEVAGVAPTNEAPISETPESEAPKSEPAPTAPTAPAADEAPSKGAAGDYASPSVRRFARELGVELSKLSGTGRKGRIMQTDVQKFVKAVMQGGGAPSAGGAELGLLPDPVVDFAKFGEIETVKLSRVKKISGANLHRNWVKVPHITFFEDADITELEAFRKNKKAEAEKRGVKLTPLAFIVKAAAKALVEFPEMNSSLGSDGDSLIVKKYVNIGFAVDTPHGLMVPVIKDADKKGIYDIAQEIIEFSLKARDGKLSGSDMQGGCFTISSLGGIGCQYFAPIVNMPEVGILGVSKSQMKPIFAGSDFVPRLMLPLSLSVDHRVIDGAYAGKFIVAVAKYLSDLKEIIL